MSYADNPKDLVKLLNLLKKAGVRQFKSGTLEIGFDETAFSARKGSSSFNARKEERKSLLKQEADHKMERIASLIVEDPEEFEKRAMSGELSGDTIDG